MTCSLVLWLQQGSDRYVQHDGLNVVVNMARPIDTRVVVSLVFSFAVAIVLTVRMIKATKDRRRN